MLDPTREFSRRSFCMAWLVLGTALLSACGEPAPDPEALARPTRFRIAPCSAPAPVKRPRARRLPMPTPWPFFTALAASLGFLGLMFHPWFYVIGFMAAFFTIVGWLWPRGDWKEDWP